MVQYPNSGRLAANKYKDNPKKPDMTGSIKMTRDAMRQLMMEQTGEEVEIKLSAWNMEGQYGQWLRLAWNNYKPQPRQNYGQQGYQNPQQGYQKPQQGYQKQFPDDGSDLPF